LQPTWLVVVPILNYSEVKPPGLATGEQNVMIRVVDRQLRGRAGRQGDPEVLSFMYLLKTT
jgi:hypothetical protein